MKHSLINPNQIRWNGLQFRDNPTDDIFIEMGEDLTIPLSYVGTKCVFNSRAPTEQELIYCKHYEMTSNNEWDPEHVDLNKLRGSMQKTNVVREAFSLMADSGKYAYENPGTDEAMICEIERPIILLKEMFISEINMRDHHRHTPGIDRTFVSRERHRQLSAESFAEVWLIGPNRAKATLSVTTQNGVRSAILPLSRRYRADRMYHTKRLRGKFATDTFYPTTKSLYGNKL